jgi:prophage regulatory protein
MTYHSDERYLKGGEVVSWLGVARSTIYRWVDEGHFPKPVVLGPEKDKNSTTRWLRTEVEQWLASRPREKTDD